MTVVRVHPRVVRPEYWALQYLGDPDAPAVRALGLRTEFDPAAGQTVLLVRNERAWPGDWILRDAGGRLSVCRAAEFHDLYELA